MYRRNFQLENFKFYLIFNNKALMGLKEMEFLILEIKSMTLFALYFKIKVEEGIKSANILKKKTYLATRA